MQQQWPKRSKGGTAAVEHPAKAGLDSDRVGAPPILDRLWRDESLRDGRDGQ